MSRRPSWSAPVGTWPPREFGVEGEGGWRKTLREATDKVNERLTSFESRVAQVEELAGGATREARIASLEREVGEMSNTLKTVSRDFDDRLKRLDQVAERLDDRLGRLHQDAERLLRITKVILKKLSCLQATSGDELAELLSTIDARAP